MLESVYWPFPPGFPDKEDPNRFWRPTRLVQRVSVGSAHLHFHTESRSIRMTKTRKIFIVFVTMRLEPVEADYVQENSASGTVFLQSMHGT